MITLDLLARLQCPACGADNLRPVAYRIEDGAPTDGIDCAGCRARYPIRYGLPVLLPRQALTEAEWKTWRQHLEKFQARREVRMRTRHERIRRFARRAWSHPSFTRFAGIDRGSVLDVGCGAGKFRFQLDPDRVEYVGIDPITLPEVSQFPFVQGVAERLPFRDESFTDVIVLAALHHFHDPESFFAEARRVLYPTGRLHVLQTVRQVRGPSSAIKLILHKVKDALDHHGAGGHDRSVPKHVTEFTAHSLVEQIGRHFDVVSMEQRDPIWYAPVDLYLSFSPKARRGTATAARSA